MHVSALFERIFEIWRPRRLALFRTVVQPGAADRLLDVGGYPASWTHTPQDVAVIDCVNLHAKQWEPSQHPDHTIRVLIGDGRALEIEDGAYDIVFSNSVIEHVGTAADQRRFADETRRVGRRLWVQTPALAFPVEPHYLTPFVHWLPRSWQRRLLRRFSVWGWIEKPTQAQVDAIVAEIRLLRRREFAAMYPDCKILTERILWVLPKSYIAVRT